MIGKSLAHYEILEKLGKGGMGVVYRARDTKLGREVALKILPAEKAKNPEFRSRFLREARAIAALKHPHIVTIHSVEESDDALYLTMEHVEGKTFSKLIPKNGFSLEKFFEYAVPLADAVGSAHERGITHRDLKPANVMVDRDGRLKVLDFGLAKIFEGSSGDEDAETVAEGSDTLVGQILGTVSYMSPEQAEGKRVDHRSDIFSLGILLYEMATGEQPFRGETHISTISSILKDEPPHLAERKRSLPRHLGRIVNRCLEKDPEQRYQTAKDLRNDLQGLEKEISSGDLARARPVGSGTRGFKKRWQWFAMAGVVLALLLVVSQLRRSADGGFRGELSDSQDGSTAEPEPRQMTVVLPFENLGPTEDAYFAAGMTEEITSRLASVSGLGVISRTSATQYDRTGKTMKEIGQDLGVNYVLEGTVRWAKTDEGKGRVRITAQLIRAEDDTHIWTDSYNRELDDIFEVQSAIAAQVVEQLDVTLLGSEKELLEEKPTDNLEAYEAYLKAIEYTIPSDFSTWDREVTSLLGLATELDPGFVDAWYRLALHHCFVYHQSIERTEERLARAKKALEGAVVADSDHPRTRLARGFYYYYGFRDYDRALEEFTSVTDEFPNDSEALAATAYIYRRQGKFEKTVDLLKAVSEIDPQNSQPMSNLASTLMALRRFGESLPWLDRTIELQPLDDEAWWTRAMLHVQWKGDLAAAKAAMRTEPGAVPLMHYVAWTFLSMWERNWEKASIYAEQLPSAHPFTRAARQQFIANIAVLRDGVEPARPELEAAARDLQAVLDESPTNAIARSWLGVTLAHLGREQEAAQEAKLAVELTAKDAFEGPGYQIYQVYIYSLIGRQEEAIDLLERLLEGNYLNPLTVPLLRIDPFFDPLRDHPRFKKLVAPES